MSKIIGRIGDMSPERALVLTRQSDGDIILSIGAAPRGMPFHLHEDSRMGGIQEDPTASVEFCSMAGGGGRSPAVMAALRSLWEAIEADNAARPDLAIEH